MTDRTLAAGLIGLAALSLAACQSPYASTTHDPGIHPPTPNFPVRTDPNPPAPAPTAAAPAAVAPAAPSQPSVAANSRPADPGPITSQALPPPTAAAQPPVEPNPPAPVVAVAPPPTPPPAPVMETRFVTAGPIVDVDGPSAESHTVKAGETLYSISRSLGLSVDQAAAINNLKAPYTLKVGQKIKGKPSKGKAYVVQNGDTLSAIGRRFSVSATQIAEANDSDVGASIRPGQRLVLPKGYRDLGAQQIQIAVAAPPAYAPVTPPPARPSPPPAPVATAVSSPPPPRPVMPPPAARPQTPPPANTQLANNPAPARPVAAPIIPTAPAATANEISAAGRDRFIWPISGRQLNAFGSRGGNQQSNGLNIAAPSGAPVKAAAPGVVMYAGSEVQGFGNLVLLQHENGFVSVYAHLSKINVSARDQVRQGQEIGLVGQSGGVAEPQLYFEMRHQPNARDAHKPFDPTLVLPSL